MRSLALVGAGRWGKNLLRNFDALGALRLVCDIYLPEVPGVEVIADFEGVLNHPDITRVAIATPSATHYSLAKRALLAGKDVFVEKPLALSVKEGEELIQLAEERGRILMVGHILRYHPAYVRLQELVKEGAVGTLRYLASHRLANDRMKGVESVLWNYGPHDLSLILPLVGEMPERVGGDRGTAVAGKVDDIRTLHMTFPSGVAAHCYLSCVSPYKEHKLTVVGDKGALVFDDVRPWGEKLMLDGKAVAVAQAEPLKEECRHFLACCEERKRPLTDGSAALQGLKVLEQLK
ncbi:MAG: Gfo/Idh/MocA family protein [Parachlamydiales bacterium]